jgi:hypothetical protein
MLAHHESALAVWADAYLRRLGPASTTTQGAELTLGYRDFDIAIVPVAVTDGAGQIALIQGDVRGTGTDRGKDALSVFGHFGATTEAGTTAKIGLGKFFATGLAAQHLAVGFAEQLEKQPPTR